MHIGITADTCESPGLKSCLFRNLSPWRKLFMVSGTRRGNSQIQVGWSHMGRTRNKRLALDISNPPDLNPSSYFPGASASKTTDRVSVSTVMVCGGRTSTLSECRRSCPRGPETSAPSGLTRAGAHVTGGSTRRLSEPEDQHLQVGGPCLLGGSSRFVREKSSHFFQAKLCSRGSIR